jgi:hypothetical protein
LVTTALTGQTVTVPIPPGQSFSPTTVATGGVAFDPLTTGTTTVSATIPGVIATTAASVMVTVSTPGMTMFGLPRTVGAGLQEFCCTARLGASAHGGVTMHIESSDPSRVLLAPNTTTAGTMAIDVVVPNGSTDASFVVQGVEGTTGSATITASAPGFTNGSGLVTVVQPALRLESLSTSIASTAANNAFFVRVGLPNASNTNLAVIQDVRRGGPTLTATVTNSMESVGQLVTTAQTGQTVTVQIPPGQSFSPTTVATGGVAFDPLTAGTTTVVGAIPGFITTTAGSVTVTVTP